MRYPHVMSVYIGADHRGFSLKEKLYEYLKTVGFDMVDMGPQIYDGDDDDVDFAQKVCEVMGGGDRGILICGSGHGMDIAANRYSHVRCVVGYNLDVTSQAREHENANVLALPADWLETEEAVEIVKTFLTTDFPGEDRYVRRLDKLKRLP